MGQTLIMNPFIVKNCVEFYNNLKNKDEIFTKRENNGIYKQKISIKVPEHVKKDPVIDGMC